MRHRHHPNDRSTNADLRRDLYGFEKDREVSISGRTALQRVVTLGVRLIRGEYKKFSFALTVDIQTLMFAQNLSLVEL